MQIKDKLVSFRIEPYRNEAFLQVAIDLLILIFIPLFFVGIKAPVIVPIIIFCGYLTVTLIFHYRVLIQALIDKIKKDYVTETISIKQFGIEFSFAGNRFGNSYIRFFYPKELQVKRYKLKVVNECNEEKKLRAVMSYRRKDKFLVFNENQIEFFRVTYLRSSKIIVGFDLPEGIDKIASNKKMEEIKKAIHYINTVI